MEKRFPEDNNVNKVYVLLCLRQEKIRNSRYGCREPSLEPGGECDG
jgi:hypothetical protein